MSNRKPDRDDNSLIDSLLRLSGQVAGGTLELARSTATLTAMFGETWLRNMLRNSMEPERLEAMADAGRFLRDARETAGLSLKDLADSLGVSDKQLLEDVESGDKIMPLELVLRCASLLARHDPIPFLIKFMRTYNPQLEQALESWGVMALPKQYERERRFINLYRKHDTLRGFSDDEFQRFIDYMEGSSNLVLDVMAREKAANARPAGRKTGRAATAKPRDGKPVGGKPAGGKQARKKQSASQGEKPASGPKPRVGKTATAGAKSGARARPKAATRTRKR